MFTLTTSIVLFMAFSCERITPASDSGESSSELAPGTLGNTTDTPGPYTIQSHADECAEAGLGYLPVIDCINDAVVLGTHLDGHEILTNTIEQNCDDPAVLPLGGDDGQCIPYSRIGRVKGVDASGNVIPEADWVFICRRYEMPSAEEDPVFADVALIGHNSENGATCFMQGFPHDHGSVKPLRIPPPGEAAKDTPAGEVNAEEFWLHPKDIAGIRCLTCHDSDPFLHTPHVDQAMMTVDGDLERVVPDASERDRPYWIVGTQHFDSWPDPTHISPDGNTCVGCHRVGTETSCGRLSAQLTGQIGIDHTSVFGQSFPTSHTMPPGVANAIWAPYAKQLESCVDGPDVNCSLIEQDLRETAESEWNALYLADLEEILDCCQQPDQDHCNLAVSGTIQANHLDD